MREDLRAQVAKAAAAVERLSTQMQDFGFGLGPYRWVRYDPRWWTLLWPRRCYVCARLHLGGHALRWERPFSSSDREKPLLRLCSKDCSVALQVATVVFEPELAEARWDEGHP